MTLSVCIISNQSTSLKITTYGTKITRHIREVVLLNARVGVGRGREGKQYRGWEGGRILLPTKTI